MKPFHSDRVLTHIQEYNSEKNLKKQLLWKDVFIYQEGGVIFGTIALVNFGTSEQLSKYSISNLFVTPKAQGRGIGTKLLEYIIQNAKINNIYILHVPSSRNAIGFYEKFGFKVNQEQPDISDEITWMHKNITSFDNT